MLLGLSEDLILHVCRLLNTRQRVALFCCCKALLRFSLTDPACLKLLETVEVHYPCTLHAPTTAFSLWLQRRRTHIKRLFISEESLLTSTFLLGALVGLPEPPLVSLAVEALYAPGDLGAWLLGFPRLKYLSISCGSQLSVAEHISHLTTLTGLCCKNSVGVWPGEAWLSQPHLPASLLSVELEHVPFLPHAVTALAGLRRLSIHTGGDAELIPAGLSAVTSLTSLQLAWCALQRLPSELAALSQLAELDLHENDFRFVGDEGSRAAALLAGLSSVTALYMQHCTAWGTAEQVGELPLNLPSLQVLNVSDTRGAFEPAVLGPSMRRLSMDVTLAVQKQSTIASLPALQDLYLTVGRSAMSRVLARQAAALLPAFQQALRVGAPTLRRVLLEEDVALSLGPHGGGKQGALMDWARQLPGVHVLAFTRHRSGSTRPLVIQDMPSWDGVE